VQAGLGKKQEPISKITSAKRTRVMAQAVESLPHNCETLSSTLSIKKKKKKERKK
jgi:hypothetical protein